MLFWFIATAITAIACVALFYAAGRRAVNAGPAELDDANSHFRLVLAGIDADVASGKLGDADAAAAKGELAREILRLKAETGQASIGSLNLSNAALLAGLGGIAIIALGLYGWLGSPDLPAQPLASRTDVAAQAIDLDAAIERIEAQLTANSDDLRGWTVIAPAYLQLGRFADAARAYRRIMELGETTPDLQTSLAEALMLDAGSAGSAEALQLLRAAAEADPGHVLSRLYIAAELMREGDFAEAAEAWQAALDLSQGEEPWLPAARQGLAAAQNGGVSTASDEAEAEMIGQMVSGLASRLEAEGGSVEEWTQLVRAYLVLGDTDSAQAAYDDAVAAYPQAFDRGELDTLALGAGLTLNGAQP